MKNYFLACLLCLACLPTYGQNRKTIDSLMNLYNTAKQDTTKILYLENIVFSFVENKPDTALLLAEKIHKWSEKINFNKGIAIALFGKGCIGLRKKQLVKALSYLEQALKIYTQLKIEKKIIDTYDNILTVYLEQKQYAKALKVSFELTDFSLQSSLTNLRAETYYQIAFVYEYLNMQQEAIQYYHKLLLLSKSTQDKIKQLVAIMGIGTLDSTKTETYTKQAIEISKDIQSNNREVECYMILGDYYIKRKKYEVAKQWIEKAFEVGIKKEYPAFNFLWTVKAELLWEMGKEDEALEAVLKALKQINNESIDKLNILLFSKRNYKLLHTIYEKQGKYKEALAYQKAFLAYQDSLGNNEVDKQRLQMELKQAFAEEKAQKELENQQRLATQRLYLYISLVGLGFALVIVLFVVRSRQKISQERQKSDKLLLNILPTEVASELKETGKTEVRYFESVTVLFADVKGFSALATKISPQALIAELDATFSKMDEISLRFGLERIKTIGDCYMACGGLPHANKTHPFDVVLTALNIQHWMNEERERRQGNFWQVRLGLHTGDAVAGVIGKTKFAYDIWGNTVNLASRMESGGEVGKVNVTQQTFEIVKDYFEGDYREEIEAKNIGKVRAYFIDRLKPEFSQDELGFEPNERFWEKYRNL